MTPEAVVRWCEGKPRTLAEIATDSETLEVLDGFQAGFAMTGREIPPDVRAAIARRRVALQLREPRS